MKKPSYFLFSAGPHFMSLTLFSLLIWIVPFTWPFVFLSCLGWICTSILKGKGVILSWISIGALTIWQYPLISTHFWYPLFLASLGVSSIISWLLERALEQHHLKQNEKIEALAFEKEETLRLQQMQETQLSSLQQQLEEQEKKHQSNQSTIELSLVSALRELRNRQEEIEHAKQESALWMKRCEELTALREKEKALEALHPCNPIIETQDDNSEELLQLQIDLRQLQKQFEEKTQVLTESRKQLFQKEGELLMLQKEHEEQIASLLEQDRSFHAHLSQLEEERIGLEKQVEVLEQMVSQLLVPKKATRARKTPAKKKTGLKELLDESLKNQTPEQYSLLEDDLI